jgi:hypothetical protein
MNEFKTEADQNPEMDCSFAVESAVIVLVLGIKERG